LDQFPKENTLLYSRGTTTAWTLPPIASISSFSSFSSSVLFSLGANESREHSKICTSDSLNDVFLLKILSEFRQLFEAHAAVASKNQSEITKKIKRGGKLVKQVIESCQKQDNAIDSVERQLKKVDNLNTVVLQVNNVVKEILAKMEYIRFCINMLQLDKDDKPSTFSSLVASSSSLTSTVLPQEGSKLSETRRTYSNPNWTISVAMSRYFPKMTDFYHQHRPYNRSKSSRYASIRHLPEFDRGVYWKEAIGNVLGITLGDFLQYQQQAERYRQKLKSKKMSFSTENEQVSVQAAEDLKEMELESLFRLIIVDVPRTFIQMEHFSSTISSDSNGAWRTSTTTFSTTNELLSNKGEQLEEQKKLFQSHLTQVLEAFVIFRSDVGYAQGMSYVAGMLLNFMEPFDTFSCFANLLNSDFFVSLYKMDLNKLEKYLNIFSLLFAENLPQLYSYFLDTQISSEQYLLSWLSTLFCKSLPKRLSCQVWDELFSQGELYLFRTALGILRMFESTLMSLTFEECLQFLRELPADLKENKFFDSIESISIPDYIINLYNRISSDQS